MDKVTVTRRLTFCAGHRLVGHDGGCAHIHGHNYVAEIEVSAPYLDEVGRVVDFSVIKDKVGSWIDDNWDHAFLVNRLDDDLCQFLVVRRNRLWIFDGNPTAERMAEILMEISRALLPPMFTVESVTVWETENCWATVKGG
jgi:6-pyruvoyltetrahydropterin/6-carboxytetrahydropterin synthase